jgi:pimeloyl-ACP methyl ester carboxylesterase
MPALEARGVQLSWGERGLGSPVLLIHETATNGAVWGPVAGALRDHARVIFYDRRGWGASSAPDGYRRTTIQEQSEDAAVLIEDLGAAPAVVCGAGLGAVIALDLLLRRPDRVGGAILIEPPLLGLVPEATRALSDDRQDLEKAYRDRGAAGVVTLYLSGSLQALGTEVGQLPTGLTSDTRERPAILLAELGAAMSWSMPLLELASAERPSLIVTAPSTPPLVREAVKALRSRLADSDLRELETTRGPPHIGAPDAIAELALELRGGG